MLKGRVTSFILNAKSLAHRRESSRSLRAASHVGRLPPETFIDIIHYLVFPTLPDALLFLHSAPGVDAGTDVWGLVEIQTTLHRVCLVCRAWNNIGTELLYTYPCFVSPKQVRRFSRTLRSTPVLARFIKHIYVVEASNLKIGLNIRPKDKKRNVIEDNAKAILNACKHSSLETLTTDVVDHIGAGSIASFFLEHISYSSRLRRLVINGIPDPDTFARLSLPSLQVLCLRTTFLSKTTVFPVLPNLDTLQIAKGDVWVELGELVTNEKMPRLSSLELYHCEYVVKTFHPLVLPRLERMHFVGPGELALYKHLLISGALDKLKYITLGFFDTFNHPEDLSETQLPLMLESLTLIGVLARNAGIRSITRYLEKNQEVLPAKYFRCLEFICTKIDCDGNTVHELQTLCDSLGIEFRLSKMRMWFWLLSNAFTLTYMYDRGQ